MHKSASIRLGVLVILYFLFDGLFMLAAGSRWYPYEDNIKRNLLPLRFVQFMLSSTCSSLAVALTLGVRSMGTLVAIGALNVLTMAAGLLAEVLHYVALRYSASPAYGRVAKTEDKMASVLLRYSPAAAHGLGWLAHIAQWAVMIYAFYHSATSGTNEAPLFVYGIVAGMALVHVGFGLEQALVLRDSYSRFAVECVAVCVSPLAKVALGWALFGYVFMETRNAA
jgi:hypothetical protein